MIFSNILLATVAAAGVVHVPLTVQDVKADANVHEYLSKRALPNDVHHSEVEMGGIFYIANLALGTPVQDVNFCFDTGSGHLWVPGTNSTACKQNKCKNGAYDVSKSTSWKYYSTHGNWGGNGIDGLETVSYAGETLENFHLWVSLDQMANNFGIFGQSADKDPTLSFVQGLAQAKKITRPVYNLASEAPITDWNSWHGQADWKRTHTNVYYGGFDSAKYEGPLVTIDCDHYGGYAMPMSGFAVDGVAVPNTKNHQIVLDTGGIRPTLPNNTMKAVAEKAGGHWDAQHKLWTGDCNAKPVLSYGFGYTAIDLEMENFLRPLTAAGGACFFQDISIVPDNQVVLLTGPQVISKAFVIYDNDRTQIHIARAKYTSESDVQEITGDIPNAVLYSDWLAGKPLPAGQRPISSAAAAAGSSASVQSSVLSTLSVKTTTASAPAPTSAAPAPAPSASPSSSQFCGFFGIFCISNESEDGNDN